MSIPFVIENEGTQERVLDIYSRLLQDRVVILGSSVNDQSSNRIVAQLMYLHTVDPNAPINFYINSPGGSITAGLAIYDTMQAISCDVRTICIGQCASMGAILLTAGAKGKRYAYPNSRIMIHQPLAGMEGTATELDIHVKELLSIKKRMNEILREHTGKSLEDIEQDTDRDKFMTAEDARDYGIIDHVVDKIDQIA